MRRAPGDGAGHFGTPVAFPQIRDGGIQYFLYNSFAVADFNGDGLPDALGTEPLGPGVADFKVWMGTAKGAFAAPQTASIPGTWDDVGWGSLTATDVNGDHHLDFVQVGAWHWQDICGAIAIVGDGHGGFTYGTPTPFIAPPDAGMDTSFCYGSMFGDFDGDGRVDAAAWLGRTQPTVDGIGVLFGDGAGGFGNAVVIPLPDGNATQFVAGDFDGDGKADLAGFVIDATNSNLEDLDVLMGTGDRAHPFGSPQRLHANAMSAQTVSQGRCSADGGRQRRRKTRRRRAERRPQRKLVDPGSADERAAVTPPALGQASQR
jgi:hypothetical protein